MEISVGILAIGNEVVEGQITNRNAAWLSEQLSKMGAQPLYHLSCRDQTQEIISSLNFLSSKCHFIIVSGGLGPTLDDCTRQSLSQWLGLPLQHNDEQWVCIKKKLTDRSVTIREGHKNQALIPEGAHVLCNSKGVAPGFFVKSETCFLSSLPGPPSELQAMFAEELKPLIESHLKPKPNKILKTWICLGAPESEVAHIAESILGNEFELGYRLHKPYVELKVWLPTECSKDQTKRLDLLDNKLTPWLVGYSIDEIRKTFHNYLNSFENVFVIDHLTSGLLLEKLKEGAWADHLRYQCFEHKAFRNFSQDEVKHILSTMQMEHLPKALFVSLFAASENKAWVSYNQRVIPVELPKRIPVRSKLGQLYIIEQLFLNHS